MVSLQLTVQQIINLHISLMTIYNSVYRYKWNTEQWNKLPSCPYYHDCALVIIDVAVGGYESLYTNKLWTL